MNSPFPGMDPYLEDPALWADFHQRMITYIGEQLTPQVRPRYWARVEERLVVVPSEDHIRPDVTLIDHAAPSASTASARAFSIEEVIVAAPTEEPLHEAYIEIVDRQNRHRVVTVIEMISPTNKTHGDGQKQYLRKQSAVLGSRISLVEIDLLRAGQHTVAAPKELIERRGPYDYLTCLRKGWERGRYYVCRRTVRDPLMPIRIPLAENDRDASLDLAQIFSRFYDAADYGGQIDYSDSPFHELPSEDAAWSDELLREKGLRS